MEEYDYKINRNNPILTAKVMSSLIGSIQEQLHSNIDTSTRHQSKEIRELKYLKDKCVHGDPVICTTASKCLVYLVKCGTIQISSTMSELVAMIPLTKIYRGIVMAITELLVLDLKAKSGGDYECPFNLAIPQHPLISVLLKDPSAWVDVLSYIAKFYRVNDKTEIILDLNELFRPVYIYILCDPFLKMPQLCRMKLFSFLVQYKYFDEVLLSEIVGWLQISSDENILYYSTFIIDLINSEYITNEDFQEFLLLWLTSFLYELYLNKCNVIATITCISDNIDKLKLKSASVMLLIVANCICVVPVVYLEDLLNLCIKLLNISAADPVVLHSLKASLLNWMLYPSVLTKDCSQLINNIYSYVKDNHNFTMNTKPLQSNKYLLLYQNTNQHVHIAAELCLLSESWLQKTENDILKWLNRDFNNMLSFLQTFLSGIFLYDYSERITLKAFSILLDYTSSNKDMTNNLLTLILYKLSNTSSPEMQFNLLKALPKMGILKENLQLIISTLKILASNSVKLRTFAMTLFYDLWLLEPKCYPYLQNLITEDSKIHGEEFHITTARVLKDICIKRPELYGAELAAHLSKILNQCKSDSGTSTALALEGLKYLCTEGVVDIVTAWDTLAPSFSTENRTIVIKSFCELVSEVPNLSTESSKYEQMVSEVVNKLWYYTTNSSDLEVIESAYKALSCFSLEDISSQFPDIYRTAQTNVTMYLYNSYEYVPGSCWLLVLQNGNRAALSSAAAFVSRLISTEISEYGRGIYSVPANHGEPHNFNSLPEHSIVRALGNYIKMQIDKFDEINVTCLKILSQEYIKPLPPLDWCFLQELVHRPLYRKHCIDLASHQVVLSGTARRLIENFITAVTENANDIEDIACIVKNLRYLCNSIQPSIIKPFLESSSMFALEIIKNQNDYSLFNVIILHVKEVLKKYDIHETNKHVLAQVIVSNLQNFHMTSEIFTKTLDCVNLVPFKHIKEFICLKQWTEIHGDTFRRATRIRCALAIKSDKSPLVWLNEIIDVAGYLKEEQDYVLQEIVKVLCEMKDNSTFPDWILELLGQIEVKLADGQDFACPVIPFMCDVLIVSIVVMSSHNILLQDENEIIDKKRIKFVFPQALRFILSQDKWGKYISQILDWLYHLVKVETIPRDYKTAFCQALVALRHHLAFKESLKWMKYLECRLKYGN